MQFIFDGNIYKAIKISGPKHNILGLALDDIGRISECKIVALYNKNPEINISASDVMEQVQAGIQEINKQFGVNYAASQIQYVPADTPSQTIYKELTMEILKRIIEKGSFTRI